MREFGTTEVGRKEGTDEGHEVVDEVGKADTCAGSVVG